MFWLLIYLSLSLASNPIQLQPSSWSELFDSDSDDGEDHRFLRVRQPFKSSGYSSSISQSSDSRSHSISDSEEELSKVISKLSVADLEHSLVAARSAMAKHCRTEETRVCFELDEKLEGSMLTIWDALDGKFIKDPFQMVRFLLSLMRFDRRPNVRKMAIWSLGDMADKLGDAALSTAIDPLIWMEMSEDVLWALSRILERVVVSPTQAEHLILMASKALQDADDIAMDACFILSSLFNHLSSAPNLRGIVQSLFNLLERSDPNLAMAALLPLCRLVDSNVISPLIGEGALMLASEWLDPDMDDDLIHLVVKLMRPFRISARIQDRLRNILPHVKKDQVTTEMIAEILEMHN